MLSPRHLYANHQVRSKAMLSTPRTHNLRATPRTCTCMYTNTCMYMWILCVSMYTDMCMYMDICLCIRVCECKSRDLQTLFALTCKCFIAALPAPASRAPALPASKLWPLHLPVLELLLVDLRLCSSYRFVSAFYISAFGSPYRFVSVRIGSYR
jgi:hypothetical protein